MLSFYNNKHPHIWLVSSKLNKCICFGSVAKSCPALQPHGLQHARPPCPSPCPGVCASSCPLTRCCHPTISSLCYPLLLLPSIFPSIRVFSNESVICIRWPKYWSFSFSISPFNEYSEFISFSIDWFDVLPFQGTLKSLLQHHSSKAPILQCSAFFMVQLSHWNISTGKTIALTIQMFVSKVMSLLFNTQTSLLCSSRFVIAFLGRSNCLLTNVYHTQAECWRGLAWHFSDKPHAFLFKPYYL